jgi:hypothetical protein
MTLNDGDVAALADRAASAVDLDLDVRIAPGADHDPYRWGAHFWLVRFTAADGREVSVRVGSEDAEPQAEQRLTEAVRSLAAQ